MNTRSRIQSILTCPSLDAEVTGFPGFLLQDLNLHDNPEISLPSNLRLGHLAEKVVSQLIEQSDNYQLLNENIQLIEDKQTLGELDFLIKEINTDQVIHLELAYKFYIYDPSISGDSNFHWIGPNRKDSLQEKIQKLSQRQFPLLHHQVTNERLQALGIDTDDIKQMMCFLINLYVPKDFNQKLRPGFSKAVRGHFVYYDDFLASQYEGKLYHIPNKLQWGIDPETCEQWLPFSEVEAEIKKSMVEEQSVLCWVKEGGVIGELYEEMFICIRE